MSHAEFRTLPLTPSDCFPAANEAANRFLEAVVELADKAQESPPPIGDLGAGLTHAAETARHVELLSKEAIRPLSEMVILPLTSRLETEKRHVKRLEQEYEKQMKMYTHVGWPASALARTQP